jgi:Spy/CpxP family protein refolding chaperone
MNGTGSSMTHWLRRCALGISLVAMFALAGSPAPQRSANPGAGEQPGDLRLPNGKLQKDEILKEEHRQNIKDAAQLAELAQQLQLDLEKNDYSVLSLSTLKKTDDIEKLAKRIRARLRHD